MTRLELSEEVRKGVSAPKAGLVTTGLTLVNVLLGFAFQSLIAAQLGLSQISDDFQFAWSIVTFGTIIFFTLVPILLVPRLEDANRGVIKLGDWPKFVLLGIILTIAQFSIASFCEPNLGDILRWSSFCHLYAAMTAIPQAVAYVRNRFVAAGIGPAINGAALLCAFLWLGQGGQPAGLGAALAAGYLIQFLVVLLLSMPKSGPYSWATEIPVRHFVFLLAFTLLSKFQPLLERVLSLTAPTGATATLGFGQKLAQGLLLFAAFGLALTANATLARRVKMGQLDKAAELLAKTVVTTVLFSTLVVLGMLPVQRAVIEILFVRGEFSSSDAVAVNDVLLCQIPWVLVCALTGALTSYLYIEQNYRHVAIASIIGLAVTYAASVVLQPLLPLTAVPIASSAGAGLTLAWVVYLVIGSPVWQLLRTELKMYSELLVTCLLAVIASFSVAAGLRLLLDIEVSAVASGLVCSAILLVFIVGITFSRMLREQWRNVIGGRLS